MNLRTRISRLEQTLQPKENSEHPAYSDECICYPKLRYGLSFKSDELRAAQELQCPLHGNRIPNPHETVYVPSWVQDRETVCDWEITRPGQREQYEKAARASRAYLEGHK